MTQMEQNKQLPGISREAEEEHLAQTIRVAQDNLDKNIAQEKSLQEDIHVLLETYGPKDMEALSLIQNTQAIYEDVQRDRGRCEKARKKPYFGRIDFFDEDSKKEEVCYIGRVGISKDIIEKVVIDWRAPIASVYYENAIGPCEYTVKNERTYGIDLKRKRTYEIEQDQLKDFYDSDVVANDELLTKYLAKNKKAVLGEIIATIQKEQNAIIRKSPKQNVIVQGSAGSGKTTVAMHRISYILYNYDKEFRPEDFYIIGSNRILLNYITGVLPDLDVYGIRQMTMEQLFTRLLYEDWDEKKMKFHVLGKDDNVIHQKGTLRWFHHLEEFCRKLENEAILQRDIYLEIPSKGRKTDVLLLSKEAVISYIRENPMVSIQNKIAMLNHRVMAKVQNEITGKNIAYTEEDKKEIRRNYRFYFGPKEWKKSIFELYKEFLLEQRQHGSAVSIPENNFDVYDLAALAYLYKRVKETELVREASHVVIDEAQDFGMMVYSVLKYCMRGCTFTIMGDVSQNIHYGYGLNDWEELRKLFLTGPFDSFELLRKSYRNTIEISDFAMKILQHGNFPIYPVEPIIRHGKDVLVRHLTSGEKLFLAVKEQVECWQKDGLETIAIVCRDEKETAYVISKLNGMLCLSDMNPEKAEFGSGVMVLSVEYTKGLEFDAVLLFDPDREKYPSDDAHVKLLYVAATRALHELTVFYLHNLTGLIADPVPEHEQRVFQVEEKKPERKIVKSAVKKPENKITGAAEKEMLPNETCKEKKQAQSAKPVIQREFQLTEHHTAALSGKSATHQFGDIPENGALRPAGHGRIDTAVRWTQKTDSGINCISNYGVLHLMPVSDAIIRVTFGSGDKINSLFHNQKTQAAWKYKEARDAVLFETDKIRLEVDKKTGAASFSDASGKTVLREKAGLPRQMDEGRKQNWMYFDWSKTERLSAKGILKDDRLPLKNTAKYICYGGKSKRFPLVHSNLGYGIAVAADSDVLCCNIPMYGPYIMTEHMELIDYYFILGKTENEVIDYYIEFMNGCTAS